MTNATGTGAAIFAIVVVPVRRWRMHIIALCRHRFRSYADLTVHTDTQKLRFHFYPLWDPYSKMNGFVRRFRRRRVDERAKPLKSYAFWLRIVSVWTGSNCQRSEVQCVAQGHSDSQEEPGIEPGTFWFPSGHLISLSTATPI